MLNELARIYDDAGDLVSVEKRALFEGDSKFVTTVVLHFQNRDVVFRANPNDDTFAVKLEALTPEPEESMIDASHFSTWSGCLGLGVWGAWQLTNQQGYTDGVRLEFGKVDEPKSFIIELIVVASVIQMCVVHPAAAADRRVAAHGSAGRVVTAGAARHRPKKGLRADSPSAASLVSCVVEPLKRSVVRLT